MTGVSTSLFFERYPNLPMKHGPHQVTRHIGDPIREPKKTSLIPEQTSQQNKKLTNNKQMITVSPFLQGYASTEGENDIRSQNAQLRNTKMRGTTEQNTTRNYYATSVVASDTPQEIAARIIGMTFLKKCVDTQHRQLLCPVPWIFTTAEAS